MIDIYLCATDEATLREKLKAAGMTREIKGVETDETIDVPSGCMLDVIGSIDGADGFHANLRLLDVPYSDVLDDIRIEAPETPVRVWA
jgi:hypothetical protein